MLGAVWTLWIRNCKHAKLKGNPDTLMPCISEKILRARSLGNSCLVSWPLGEERKGAICQGSKTKKSVGTERPAGGKATNDGTVPKVRGQARKRTCGPATTLESSKKATRALSTRFGMIRIGFRISVGWSDIGHRDKRPTHSGLTQSFPVDNAHNNLPELSKNYYTSDQA